VGGGVVEKGVVGGFWWVFCGFGGVVGGGSCWGVLLFGVFFGLYLCDPRLGVFWFFTGGVLFCWFGVGGGWWFVFVSGGFLWWLFLLGFWLVFVFFFFLWQPPWFWVGLFCCVCVWGVFGGCF